MKVFLCWSGTRSLRVAEALRDWLRLVIQAVEPWLSSSDLDPGARWSPEIAKQLEETRFGIICLTADNLAAPWIHFEAGALSKHVDRSRVVPYLLDLKPSEVKGPLSHFQGLIANEGDTRKLVEGVNKAVLGQNEPGLSDGLLTETFSAFWPRLKAQIDGIPGHAMKAPPRGDSDLLEEILGLVRSFARRQATLEGWVYRAFREGRNISFSEAVGGPGAATIDALLTSAFAHSQLPEADKELFRRRLVDALLHDRAFLQRLRKYDSWRDLLQGVISEEPPGTEGSTASDEPSPA